jgi:hypothetical protein
MRGKVGLTGTDVSEEPAVLIFRLDQTKCYQSLTIQLTAWNIAFLFQLMVEASGTTIFRNVSKLKL